MTTLFNHKQKKNVFVSHPQLIYMGWKMKLQTLPEYQGIYWFTTYQRRFSIFSVYSGQIKKHYIIQTCSRYNIICLDLERDKKKYISTPHLLKNLGYLIDSDGSKYSAKYIDEHPLIIHKRKSPKVLRTPLPASKK